MICGDIPHLVGGPWIAELRKGNIKLTDVGQTVESIEVLIGADCWETANGSSGGAIWWLGGN